MKKKPKTLRIARDAKTGRYISMEEANRRPEGTVTEPRKPPAPKKNS